MLLLELASLVWMPYLVLMPIFAKDILHGDAHTLGFLTAAAGIGAPNTVLISGGICIIGTIIFLTRLPSLRKIFH